MRDLNDKVTGSTLAAAEFNEIPSEIQNAITDSGQTLSSGDLAQLSKAIGGYSKATKTLAAAITPVAGKTMFVESSDGGLFKAVTGAAPGTYSDNGGSYCGTQFIPTSGDGTKAWVRVDGGLGYLPEWFGAVGDGTTDDTLAIQNTIDTARDSLSGLLSTTGGGKVIISAGVYAVTKITRRSGVSIIGAGSRSTYFVALPTSDTVPYGMFEIEDGPVVGSHMRGIFIYGSSAVGGSVPVNSNQWALYLHAKWDAGYVHGGLWYSDHEDVHVRSFNYGLWSRGGYTAAHSRRPQQYLKFDQCAFSVENNGIPSRFTGQHGQIYISGGDHLGSQVTSTKASTCLTFDWDPDPSTTADNSSGYGESTSDVSGAGNAVRAPEHVYLGGATSCGLANNGIYARNSQINIGTMWFEGLGGAIETSSNARIQVENSRFADAADGLNLSTPSAGNGWAFKQGANTSIVMGDGNYFIGTIDNIYDPTNSYGDADQSIFHTSNITTDGLYNSSGVLVKTIDASGVIDIEGHTDFRLRANATPSILLETITSNHGPSTYINIYADTGAVTLSSADNILLPNNRTEITIGNDSMALLYRIHGFSGKEWKLISVTDEFSSTVPAGGEYYSRDTKIWKLGSAAASSPGWICTTAGTAGGTAVFKAMPNLAA